MFDFINTSTRWLTAALALGSAVAPALAAVADPVYTTQFGLANPLNPGAPGSAWMDENAVRLGAPSECVSDLTGLSTVNWVAPADPANAAAQVGLMLTDTPVDIADGKVGSSVVEFEATWSASRFGAENHPFGSDAVPDPDADVRLGTCGWVLKTGRTNSTDPASVSQTHCVFASDTAVYAFQDGIAAGASAISGTRIASKNRGDVITTRQVAYLNEQPVRFEWFVNGDSVLNYTGVGGPQNTDVFEVTASEPGVADGLVLPASSFGQWDVTFACLLGFLAAADDTTDVPESGLVSSTALLNASAITANYTLPASAVSDDVADALFGQGVVSNLYAASIGVSHV